MDRCLGAAARLPESGRKDLAVQALARSATISDLSTRHGGSRKFVYQQANKARRALDDAFISADADDEVLFEIAVTKRWLRQGILALALMCRGSYLGIIELLRDLLGASMPIRLLPTATSSRIRPCSWTFISTLIFGSHSRSQSFNACSRTTQPAPLTWRRPAGTAGLSAAIVRQRESRSVLPIVRESCAAASVAVTRH